MENSADSTVCPEAEPTKSEPNQSNSDQAEQPTKTNEIVTYCDPSQVITIEAGGEFIIAIESNPTTGYCWEAIYDTTFVELLMSTYDPFDVASGIVGNGGVESFYFCAHSSQHTTVTMLYKRPWEDTHVYEQVYVVDIT